MKYMLKMIKNMATANQGNTVQFLQGIAVFGFNVITKKYQGGYTDVDGSIDHYDRYGNHTLREAPPGSRKFDIVIPGPNVGTKYKFKN